MNRRSRLFDTGIQHDSTRTQRQQMLRQLPALLVALAMLLGPPRAGAGASWLAEHGQRQEQGSEDAKDSKESKEDGKETSAALCFELLASLPRELRGPGRRSSGTELLCSPPTRHAPLATPPPPPLLHPLDYLPRRLI